MNKYKLGEMEQRFADLIWLHEPIQSRQLSEICTEVFDWKRTTTYTMLKRLCDRGIFQNSNGIVRSLMSKNEFGALQGEQFIETSFDGSLPQFLAAFTRHKKLRKKEILEIQQLIDEHKEV
ncbi:BlaI/MecI/CopY family transcriptional regulator [Petrocella sp. FN5]|uniref:BlaI/MecI/CopY family transcriptional regulator n=1 Tax=Petrocella sp. FN5 TaxID=3032002 RepID=UPI0023DCCDC3|nr:BlaI/MecI/CopY family transcriptional regulator [Petrocella sp. FN5]MDF1616913.1 BlaI/MecI/CopY family transcriptional regulator [Petrocella sp. FN5]